MSKKIKAIIAGGVAIVLLVAALITLVIIKNASESSSSEEVTSTESIEILDEDYTTIKRLYIKNPLEEYTILPNGSGGFYIETIKDFAQMDYVYIETLQDMSNIFATKLVAEDCKDLSIYGLDNPFITFEAEYENGNSYAFSVGLVETASGTRSKYICKTGDNDVYSLPATSLSGLEKTSRSYLNMQVSIGFDEEDTSSIPNVTYMYVNRTDLSKPIILSAMSDDEIEVNPGMRAHIKLTSPIEALINETPAQTKVYGNFGIVATEVAVVKPTAAQKAEYGLSNPSATFEMRYNEDESFKLTVGNSIKDDNGNITSYYVLKDGIDQIYVCAASSLNFMTLQAEDLMSSMVICPALDSVQRINITAVSGQKYTIDFADGEPDDDGNVKTESAKVDGKTVDIDNARLYYELLLLTSVESFNLTGDTKGGSKNTTIEYVYKNGTKQTLDFYVNSKGATTIALDGKVQYNGRSGYVQKIEKEIKNLIANRAVSIDW